MPSLINFTDLQESPIRCHLPGWRSGPGATGEQPRSYFCERPNYHGGDHAWQRGRYQVTWPVGYGEPEPEPEPEPEDDGEEGIDDDPDDDNDDCDCEACYAAATYDPRTEVYEPEDLTGVGSLSGTALSADNGTSVLSGGVR